MLEMPTPESLEAEAVELEFRAAAKERQAKLSWSSRSGAATLERDAHIFRDEAKAKRAKAERLRKAAQSDADAEARHTLEHEGAGQHETLDEANPFEQ